jgi:glycosyltransferase involved in cell wall biosynthesis
MAGLPVVASDDPIRREIVGSKGLYVEPHDIRSITDAIEKGTKMAKIDYKSELKPFMLENVVSQLEKELHDLIS